MTGLTATVDDTPVDIYIDDRLTMLSEIGAGYDTLALRLNPPPEPGQRVAVGGDPSALAFEATGGSFAVEYVTDEDDVTPPKPPAAWWWDVAYEESLSGPLERDSCGFLPIAGQVMVTARFDAEATSEEQPALVRISVQPQTYALGESFAWVEFASSQEFTDQFWLYPDQLTEPVFENPLCVELEVLDVAGNSSGTDELCLPCRADLEEREGPVGWCEPEDRSCPDENPPEAPGGACTTTDLEGSGGEAGREGTEEAGARTNETASNGDGCSVVHGVARDAVGASSLGATAGLLLLIRMRRRQRQEKPFRPGR